jgi:DNA-binding transcriptional LysR family regulator
MNLDRLRTFIRVAETGSLSAASDVLRIAQPALSRQVRLLEAEVGQTLFIRSRLGMQLTQAGEELLSRVSGLVRQLEQSFDDARTYAGRPGGKVRLGVVPTVAVVLAETFVRRVRDELPDVRLSLVEGHTGHILDWLHKREVDLGLFYGAGADLHVEVESVLNDELLLVGPRGHPAFASETTLARIAAWPLILPSPPHGLRLVVDRAFERAGFTADVVVEATGFITMLQMVAAGIGLTAQPHSVVARFADPARFSAAPFEPRLGREVVLGRPHGVSPSRAVAAIGRILAEEAARRLT